MLFNVRTYWLIWILAFEFSSSFLFHTPHRMSSSTTAIHSAKNNDDSSATTSLPDLTNVKAVIFDVDGTLADSGQLGFDATLVVLQNNGIDPISYEDYCDGTRYTTPERLARHAGLTPEKDNDLFLSRGQALGQEFDNLYIDLVTMETAAFYPGMLDLVQNIPPNVGVGALTNAAGAYAHAVLTVNSVAPPSTFPDLYQRFGSILGADNVAKPKPYADGLWQVCAEMNLPPQSSSSSSQCVYIGDSPSDGMAAQAAGMVAVGVSWGAHAKEKLLPHFSHVCDTVEELAALLPSSKRAAS